MGKVESICALPIQYKNPRSVDRVLGFLETRLTSLFDRQLPGDPGPELYAPRRIGLRRDHPKSGAGGGQIRRCESNPIGQIEGLKPELQVAPFSEY